MFDLSKRPDWFAQAACRGEPVETFFPERGDNATLKRAKEICADCPVQAECFDYSMELSEKYETLGVWAGVAQKTRVALLREQNKSHRHTPYDWTLLT